MAGYRGEGYGAYGDHGDDDFRWGDRRRWEGDRPERGAAQGNLMGRAQERVSGFFRDDEDHRGSERLADDPRAVRAADEWRQRHGREGYEGSYAQHDEPYRQYRERHLAELDRDYDEYCRENGHEFSSAFENWRTQRRQNPGVAATSSGTARSTAELGASGGAGGMGGAASLEPDQEGASGSLISDESGGALTLGEEGSGSAEGSPTGKRTRR